MSGSIVLAVIVALLTIFHVATERRYKTKAGRSGGPSRFVIVFVGLVAGGSNYVAPKLTEHWLWLAPCFLALMVLCCAYSILWWKRVWRHLKKMKPIILGMFFTAAVSVAYYFPTLAAATATATLFKTGGFWQSACLTLPKLLCALMIGVNVVAALLRIGRVLRLVGKKKRGVVCQVIGWLCLLILLLALFGLVRGWTLPKLEWPSVSLPNSDKAPEQNLGTNPEPAPVSETEPEPAPESEPESEPESGLKKPANVWTCSRCGVVNPIDNKCCSNCGDKQPTVKKPVSSVTSESGTSAETISKAEFDELVEETKVALTVDEDDALEGLLASKYDSDGSWRRLSLNSLSSTDAARREATGFSDALTFGFEAKDERAREELYKEVFTNPVYGVTIVESFIDKSVDGVETIGDWNRWMAPIVELTKEHGVSYWCCKVDGVLCVKAEWHDYYAPLICCFLDRLVYQGVEQWQTVENWCLSPAVSNNDRRGVKAEYQLCRESHIFAYVGKNGGKFFVVGFNLHDKRPEFYGGTPEKPVPFEPNGNPFSPEPTPEPEPEPKPEPEPDSPYDKSTEQAPDQDYEENDGGGEGRDTNLIVIGMPPADRSSAEAQANSMQAESYDEVKSEVDANKEGADSTGNKHGLPPTPESDKDSKIEGDDAGGEFIPSF